MKILVFDTETTGLPEKDASIYEFAKWPYIIQLSYILYDLSNNTIKYGDDYIKIDSEINIPQASYEKHKLTHEILREKGENIQKILNKFNNILKESDIVVGHNISFDKRMVFVECMRNNLQQNFTVFRGNKRIRKSEFCTMKETTNYCNITGYSKYNGRPFLKTPSLIELYKILFPDAIIPKHLHNSLVDILITLRCYIEFQYSFDILEKNDTVKNLFIKYECI